MIVSVYITPTFKDSSASVLPKGAAVVAFRDTVRGSSVQLVWSEVHEAQRTLAHLLNLLNEQAAQVSDTTPLVSDASPEPATGEAPLSFAAANRFSLAVDQARTDRSER